MDSVFEDGASSPFAPVKPVKAAKPKAAPKKAAGPAKPRAPKGTTKPKATKAAPKKTKKRKDDSDDENSDVDIDEDPFDDDESLITDTPPQKTKKAPGPKKPSGKPLADIANESFGMDGVDEPVAKPKKAAGGASDKYQMVGFNSLQC